jgi:hypothetical protein
LKPNPPLNYVFTPIGGDERSDLERFHYVFTKLSAWDIGTKAVKLTARPMPGVDVAGGPAWEIAMPELGEEALYAATALFRQLYDQHEPASVNRICNILSHHAKERQTEAGNKIVEDLREFRKALKDLRRESPYGRLLIEGNPHGPTDHLAPEALFNLWFNGEVQHGDPELRGEVSGDDTEVLHASALQGAIKSHMDLWSKLDRIVEMVLSERALDAGT